MRYFILVFTFVSFAANAQSWKEKYQSAINNRQDSLATSILMDWIKIEPENPDMTVAAFNHYLFTGVRDIMVMTDNPEELVESEGYLEILDAQGLPFSYIGSSTYYEPEYFNRAMELIDNGIKFNPNRLDLRFGQAYVLGETQNYELQIQAIREVLAQNKINNGEWFWMENAPVDDIQYFLPESIQDYLGGLFYSGVSYSNEIIELSNLMLEQYPDNVMYISNIGAAYYNAGDLQKAYETFSRAFDIDYNDSVVILNLGQICTELGKYHEAIYFYEKIVQTGDEYDKEFAQERINELKEATK
jgi:tetratricopeptide (TPR) repeat protein